MMRLCTKYLTCSIALMTSALTLTGATCEERLISSDERRKHKTQWVRACWEQRMDATPLYISSRGIDQDMSEMVLVVMDWGWSRCQLLFRLKAGMPLIVRKKGEMLSKRDELVCSGSRKSGWAFFKSVPGVSSVGTTLIFCLLLFASVIQPSHQSDATDNGLQV